MSAESRGKKAGDPGGRALKDGAAVQRPAPKGDGSRPKHV